MLNRYALQHGLPGPQGEDGPCGAMEQESGLGEVKEAEIYILCLFYFSSLMTLQ